MYVIKSAAHQAYRMVIEDRTVSSLSAEFPALYRRVRWSTPGKSELDYRARRFGLRRGDGEYQLRLHSLCTRSGQTTPVSHCNSGDLPHCT